MEIELGFTPLTSLEILNKLLNKIFFFFLFFLFFVFKYKKKKKKK